MKVAIIGAGCAGLVSARYCLKNNILCDVFEQTGKIGGVWNYTDKVGFDEYGLPIHTVMYKDLRTNLPKELMSYSNFAYPDQLTSFLTQPEVLSYMQQYAEHFKIMRLIKFHQQVVEVTPEDGKWKVTVLNLKTKRQEVCEYQAIMVCNGHYHKISMPSIDGMDSFKGIQIHSNVYRSPERFKHLRVLVIGAGPSGQDIAAKVSTVAEKVILSHRFSAVVRVPTNVIQKPPVRKISNNEILFEDGTKENFDAIIYCTGYKYDFPFLSKQCGVDNNGISVKYLYKHIINIEQPSMGFIGICTQICPFPVCDIQVQFFLATITGRYILKRKDELLEEIRTDINRKLQQGGREDHIHKIAEEQKNYCDDLARLGKFNSLPTAFQKLYVYVRKNRNISECFKVVNNEEYMKVDC